MTTKPKYVILLGPPAAGKGTQATRLSGHLGLAHVASGDLFRYNLKNKTELGLKAKTYMDKGALVPDDITIAMVLDRLTRDDCAGGALLDGFPRTTAQAEALDKALAEKGNRHRRRAQHHRPGRRTGRARDRTAAVPHLRRTVPHQV